MSDVTPIIWACDARHKPNSVPGRFLRLQPHRAAVPGPWSWRTPES